MPVDARLIRSAPRFPRPGDARRGPSALLRIPPPLGPVHGGGSFSATVDTILDHVYDAIFATDLDNRITFWAPSAERLFGYTKSEAEGAFFHELLPSEIAPPSSLEDLLVHIKAGVTWSGEGSVRLPTGALLWLESSVSPILEGGRVVGSVSVSRDRSGTHEAERALAERARLFHALIEYTTVANAIHDEARLAPVLVDAVASVVPSAHVVLATLDRTSGRYFIRAATGADGAVGGEVRPGEGSAGRAITARTLVVTDRLLHADYSPAVRTAITAPIVTTAAVPLLHDGAVLGAITAVRPWVPGAGFSAAEREALLLFGGHAAMALANVRLLADVSELAVHDGLTGLYNRRHFDATLELMIARWRRSGDTALAPAAIMFDLDRFGRLNRDHGHQAGDAVLRAFGGILHERLRSSDLVARYGGEEFVAILEGTSLADASRLAENIRQTLEGRVINGPDGTRLRATVSAGVAELDVADASAEALLRAADVGLFMAKRGGRNRVVTT